MKIIIKYLDKIQEFENQNTIVIGNNDSCNFFIEELKEEINKYQKNVVRLETELEDLKK